MGWGEGEGGGGGGGGGRGGVGEREGGRERGGGGGGRRGGGGERERGEGGEGGGGGGGGGGGRERIRDRLFLAADIWKLMDRALPSSLNPRQLIFLRLFHPFTVCAAVTLKVPVMSSLLAADYVWHLDRIKTMLPCFATLKDVVRC